MLDFAPDSLTSSGAAVGALLGLIGALGIRIYQNIRENLSGERQRLLDSIGAEQKIIDALSVRARLLIERLNSEQGFNPSDYEIEKALFETLLDSSNITFISHELCGIDIQGRRWAKDVVHKHRKQLLKICKDARNQKAELDRDKVIGSIVQETLLATEETVELCRAVRDRKHFLYLLLSSKSRYHSVVCHRFPLRCSKCERDRHKMA